MNLLADEGVDRQIVARLREEGHEVSYVAEMDPGMLANSEARALLTTDKDFGELVFRQGLLTSSSIILVRLSGLSSESKATTVGSAIREHASEFIPRTFAVVTPGTIRIRRSG